MGEKSNTFALVNLSFSGIWQNVYKISLEREFFKSYTYLQSGYKSILLTFEENTTE